MEKATTKIIKSSIQITTKKSGKLRVQLNTGNISNVKQSQKDETDIKHILDKYQKTGELLINTKEALYGDFSNPMDYQDALNLQIRAEDQFMSLDAEVRQKFNNDPQKFLEFATDNKNGAEMVKLGLAKARIQTIEKVVKPIEKQDEVAQATTKE